MKIGKIIRDIRRKQNMTQEELAERLNVSISAVSQWEIEKTTPDIAMLPLLAVVFNVTTDELLGLKGEKAVQRAKEYIENTDEYYRNNQLDNAINVIAKAYEEFPTNIAIVDKYAWVLKESFARSNNADVKLVNKCIELNEYVLANSINDIRRHHAVLRMCSCYSCMGDTETALKYARQLSPNFRSCSPYVIKRNNLLSSEEKIKSYRGNINELVSILDEFIVALADVESQNSTYELTIQERIDILKQRIDILNAVFGDKSLDKTYLLYETHRMIGVLYIQDGESEKAIEHLEKADDCALQFKTDYNNGECYASPILLGCKARRVSSFINGSSSALIDFYNRLTVHGFYKPLEENKKFIELKEKLTKQIDCSI